MIERFDLRDVAAQPWKNGAGITREIARGGADPSEFEWRISVAEVERDAPFSAFPGVDRCIVLLSGAGMRLSSADGAIDHRLVEPLAPFAFSGDTSLTATLVGGACRDFNVMTRRGVARSEVVCHRQAARLPPASVVCVFCVEGEWLVDGEEERQHLEPLQCVLWRDARSPVDVRPTRANERSSLLAVRLDRHGSA